MNIYVDFDDCLCETARYLSSLAASLFGTNVPYEEIRYFNLRQSFSLTDAQLELLMTEGHRPEALLAYEETPGASGTLNEWMDRGHQVSVITGRPGSTWEPSRLWMDRHGLERAKLYCFNKYGREGFLWDSAFNLEVEDYERMPFDFAVEDSPSAFRFFTHRPEMKVLVFDRPWNQDCTFPREGFLRCRGWDEIRDAVSAGEGAC